jgi:hypothetical protein
MLGSVAVVVRGAIRPLVAAFEQSPRVGLHRLEIFAHASQCLTAPKRKPPAGHAGIRREVRQCESIENGYVHGLIGAT